MKIDVAIVGFQKCGTTSLYNWLLQHPDIDGHVSFEINCFHPEYAKPIDEGIKEHFPNPKEDKKWVAKAVGFIEEEVSLQKLKAHNPDVLAIAIVRNPIERAYSAFWFAQSRGVEPEQDFSNVMKLRDRFRDTDLLKYRNCNYVERSCYYENLITLRKYFPQENTMVLEFGDLKTNPQKIVNEIFARMSLSPFEITIKTKNKTNQVKSALLIQMARKIQPIFKYFLPVSLRTRLSKAIFKLNTSQKPIPKIKPTEYEYLASTFYVENEKMKNDFGIDYNKMIIEKMLKENNPNVHS